jgi:hypothetical protein
MQPVDAFHRPSDEEKKRYHGNEEGGDSGDSQRHQEELRIQDEEMKDEDEQGTLTEHSRQVKCLPGCRRE